VNETFGHLTLAGAFLASGRRRERPVMTPWTLLILATGVSADAFAVALGKGLQLRRQVICRPLLIATLFGVAQAIMPFLGYLLGSTFAERIAPFDHWVALASSPWSAARCSGKRCAPHRPRPTPPTAS